MQILQVSAFEPAKNVLLRENGLLQYVLRAHGVVTRNLSWDACLRLPEEVSEADACLVDASEQPDRFCALFAELFPHIPLWAFDTNGTARVLPVQGIINSAQNWESQVYAGRLRPYSALGPQYAGAEDDVVVAVRLAERLMYAILFAHGEMYGVDAVKREYDEAAKEVEPYRKALWSSARAMCNRFALAQELLEDREISSWLDIGCGPGDALAFFERSCQIEAYLGVDLCPASLACAATKAAENGKREYACQDFMAPVKGEPFSLITCFGVLQKCGSRPERAIKRCAELLAPGGRLICSTKDLSWHQLDDPVCIPYEGHAWFWPLRLEAAASRAGLRVMACRNFDAGSRQWLASGGGTSLMLLARKPGQDEDYGVGL